MSTLKSSRAHMQGEKEQYPKCTSLCNETRKHRHPVTKEGNNMMLYSFTCLVYYNY